MPTECYRCNGKHPYNYSDRENEELEHCIYNLGQHIYNLIKRIETLEKKIENG